MQNKIKYLLLDLDGTLIQFDMNTFISEYLRLIQSHFSTYRFATSVPKWILEGTEQMLTNAGSMTNKEKFLLVFQQKTGLSEAEIWAKFLHFYQSEYNQLQSITRPVPGAREVLEKAVSAGYKLVVATQPVFPQIAILKRLAWAGLDHLPYILITHIENMYASKPSPQYFEQILSMLGAMGGQCLMIGNDGEMDLASEQVGIPAFYLFTREEDRKLPDVSTYAGTLRDLSDILALT